MEVVLCDESDGVFALLVVLLPGRPTLVQPVNIIEENRIARQGLLHIVNPSSPSGDQTLRCRAGRRHCRIREQKTSFLTRRKGEKSIEPHILVQHVAV